MISGAYVKSGGFKLSFALAVGTLEETEERGVAGRVVAWDVVGEVSSFAGTVVFAFPAGTFVFVVLVGGGGIMP